MYEESCEAYYGGGYLLFCIDTVRVLLGFIEK